MRYDRSACLAAAILAAAMTICARPLAAQSATTAGTSSLGATLDSSATAQLAAIVDDARGRGLPVEPIVAKARLGLLRHASADRIVAAARAVAERLEQARGALDPRPSAADIAAGADALSAGVNTDALRNVRRAARERGVAVPLGVLAQLVASGVPVARATTIVTDLVRRGAPVGQLVALGNAVDGDVRAGARADVSLGLRLRQLDAVLGPPGAAASGATSLCASASMTPDALCAAGTGGSPKKP